jgi:N-methylhydantoinase B
VNKPAYDVIAAEVHRKAIEDLTNEMAITLLRTSGSPVVIEASDFSTCLMDTEPEHLGFAAYVAFHFATSLIGTRRICELVRESGDEVRPGDGWLVNDAYVGGAAHPGDVAVITPMFYGSEHLGWGFANMHVLDVGGSGIGGIAPGAHDVWSEAVLFPAIRMIRNGAIEREWEQFMMANSRAPGPVLNDIRSMIAANNVGNRKLNEIVEAFGLERHKQFCAINKNLTEEVLRARISSMADGLYQAREWVEFDGHDGPDQLLEISVRLEVDGSDLRFSFDGAPQIDGFINGGKGAVWGQIVTAILTTLAYGDLPVNGGLWRPIHIDLGDPGSVVNPVSPAPVSSGHTEAAIRACKLTKDVLSQALALSHDPVLRGRIGAKAHDGTPVTALFGPNQHGGDSVILYLDNVTGVGGGAQTVQDGQDMYGVTAMTGCGMSDLETHEAEDPVLFLWRRVVPNSGGPGRYRGGQGLEQAFSIAYSDRMGGPAWTSCAEVPASGVGGGFPGAGSTFYLIRNSNVPELLKDGKAPLPDRVEGRKELMRSKVGHITYARDDVSVVVSGGGGGVGDPLLREPERVVADVSAGWITSDHAAAAYGVLRTDDGRLDHKRTSERREAIRRERIGRAPTKPLAAPESVGVAVVRSGDGEWQCASCTESLGAAGANWRESAVMVETEIVERYAQLRMYVRPRTEDPKVVLREHYCPSCAAGLCVDVVTQDTAMLAAPLMLTGASSTEARAR